MSKHQARWKINVMEIIMSSSHAS